MNNSHAVFLSIIVPVFNEQKNINFFLTELSQGLTVTDKHIEVIVVDGGSDDNTVQLADAFMQNDDTANHFLVDWQVVSSGAGRAKQMNKGAVLASGQYLIFLHADTYLPSSMSQWCQFLEQRQPEWGFFRLSFKSPALKFRILSLLINIRSKVTRVSTGDQAQFFRSEQFAVLGNFKNMILMEDVEISKRYRRHARPSIWHEPVLTSSRRWQDKGFTRTILLMWLLRFGYFVRIPVNRLARMYENSR